MFVIVDVTRYGTDITDEQIAEFAEEYGLFPDRDKAVTAAYELPLDPDDIMLVEIECDEGMLQ